MEPPDRNGVSVAAATLPSITPDRWAAPLNSLHNEINIVYGYFDGKPRINLGPCGRFARDFRERLLGAPPEHVGVHERLPSGVDAHDPGEQALIEQGQLVKLGDGVLFLRETYEEAIAKLVQYLREHGTMTVAEARDVLGATRKYILPLLEHLDTLKITRRLGDERVLGTL